MRSRLTKKALALLLALALCLTLLPMAALAGASEPMARYYDSKRATGTSEWDDGPTDGYLEQDSAGHVKLGLSGGVPEGNTITAVYLVTADGSHTRKATLYDGALPAGAEGGLEGNGVWIYNVTVSLAVGTYQTEYVTDHGSM